MDDEEEPLLPHDDEREDILSHTQILTSRLRAYESKHDSEEDVEHKAEDRKKTGIDPFSFVAVDLSGCIPVGRNGVGQKGIDHQCQEHLDR